MMRKLPMLLLAAGTIAATTAPPPAPVVTQYRAPPVRLPGFAAELSESDGITGPAAWRPLSHDQAWTALAAATRDTRQRARWNYARSLIAQGDGDAALGVLQVMADDDPDLALVPSWQIAHGAALSLLGRGSETLAALSGDALASNSEACAWRLRSMADMQMPDQALAQVNCALSAINARSSIARSPFVLASARAAIGSGQPEQALQWLALLPDHDSAANLYRGKAYLKLGQPQPARLCLERVARSGTSEQRVDARLSTLEAEVGDVQANPPPTAQLQALQSLRQITYTWRGGDIEERALRLSMALSTRAHDLRGTLAAGAVLVRYFPLGKDTGPLIAGLQAQLAAALAPDSGIAVAQAAGLYWEFRDLAPPGADGDLMVNQLAARLGREGLYRRAAELLDYQLSHRAKDVTQGPLSVRVATFYILAGQPDRALAALRQTDATPYPQEISWDRHRMAAVALHLLGHTSEALAVLQDVPDRDQIRFEIFWKKQDWANLAASGAALLPRTSVLGDVGQTIVLRQAIALGMLNHGDALAGLRTRYGASFAGLPTAAAFDMLTQPTQQINAAVIEKAMATLPTASPAGRIADLLDTDVTSQTNP